MRTTLTLDSDVAQEIKSLEKDEGRSFKEIVNQALRLGLRQLRQPIVPPLYQTPSRPMGLRPGYNLDNIAELLAQAEGEDRR